MQLPETEIKQFFSLYKPLLAFVNNKFHITSGIKTANDIDGYPIQETAKVREKLYQTPELIDDFLQKQGTELSSEDIELVKSWKQFIKGQFYVYRYLKKHAIFLSTDEPYKAYGVMSFYSNFDDVFGHSLPRLTEAVLLPFKDRIVSDGMFASSNLYFGSGIRRRIDDSYQEAKARFGIITSLLDVSQQELESGDAAKLKTYLKSERTREEYWHEILGLKDKNPELEFLYYQEMGKVFAKKHSKRLREIGLNEIWIGLFEEMPIASGKAKAEVERTVKQILPKHQQKFVYMFHLKGK
jgi:hypothetical protein